jgi:hypothetical protein
MSETSFGKRAAMLREAQPRRLPPLELLTELVPRTEPNGKHINQRQHTT